MKVIIEYQGLSSDCFALNVCSPDGQIVRDDCYFLSISSEKDKYILLFTNGERLIVDNGHKYYSVVTKEGETPIKCSYLDITIQGELINNNTLTQICLHYE